MSPGLILTSGVKRGLGSLVGNGEMESGLDGCKHNLPTKKLPVSMQKNFLDASGKMVFDLPDECRCFLPIQNVSLPEFAQKVLPGFINETKHRTVCLLRSMDGVVCQATPLLIAANCFPSGIDTKMNPSIVQRTELPGPFSKNIADSKNRGGLIDSKAVHIYPEGTGRRLTDKMEKTANYSIQTDIDKMPQPIETDKERHQNFDNHALVTQFGFSSRPRVELIENLLEVAQIQKLDQSKKSSRGANLLCKSTIRRRSLDFSGARRSLAKAFTDPIFRDTFHLFNNHLGYLLSDGIDLGTPLQDRKSRWFSIFYLPPGARSKYY